LKKKNNFFGQIKEKELKEKIEIKNLLSILKEQIKVLLP